MDLFGRVPLAPLRLVEGRLWSSRRVQRQTVELWADDRMVAKAQALRLPVMEADIPDQPDSRAGSAPAADLVKTDRERAAILDEIGFPNFTSDAVVMQAGSSIPARPGYSMNWIKLMLPIVAEASHRNRAHHRCGGLWHSGVFVASVHRVVIRQLGLDHPGHATSGWALDGRRV
jgi:hypothetical protein